MVEKQFNGKVVTLEGEEEATEEKEEVEEEIEEEEKIEDQDINSIASRLESILVELKDIRDDVSSLESKYYFNEYTF